MRLVTHQCPTCKQKMQAPASAMAACRHVGKLVPWQVIDTPDDVHPEPPKRNRNANRAPR
jgi:hypothetical protein